MHVYCDTLTRLGKAPHHPLAGLPPRRLKPAGIIDRHWCLWMNTTKMELRVFLSPFDAFDIDRDPLVWHVQDLKLRPGEDNHRKLEMNYSLPPEIAVPPFV